MILDDDAADDKAGLASDARPSPREPRRVWAAYTRDRRGRPFRNPRAALLAAWAEALAHEESFSAWQAEHGDEGNPLDTEAGS